MRRESATPAAMLSSLVLNHALIMSLVRREVVGRYRGSLLGILWSFFHPLLMLAVYTFVFGMVFKASWNSGVTSQAEFALILFVGLMVFNLFAECVTRAPGLIVSNVNFVKKVVFPVEVLPWVVFGAALFHLAISFLVWLGFYFVVIGLPNPTVLLLPLVLVPLTLLTMGVAWFLASLGVYLRDVSQVTGVVTTALMFVSPIFYPRSELPRELDALLAFNPLTPAIEFVRDVTVWGRVPDLSEFMLYTAVAAVVACLGFAWFQTTRKGFADVL